MKIDEKDLATTDSKNLFDLTTRTAVPNCQEFRTQLLARSKKDVEGINLNWVHRGAPASWRPHENYGISFFRETLCQGRYCLHDSHEVLKNRVSARNGLKFLKATNDEMSSEPLKFWIVGNVNGLISTVLSLATSTESHIPGRSMTSCLSEGFCGSESQKVTVVGGTDAVLLVAVASLGFCVRTHLSWRRKQSARPRVWVEVTGFIYCCPQVVLPHSSSSYNDIYIYLHMHTLVSPSLNIRACILACLHTIQKYTKIQLTLSSRVLATACNLCNH